MGDNPPGTDGQTGPKTAMKLADLDFDLPAERIARYPAARRDRSRLLVLDRERDTLQHRVFADILEYLRPEDAIVINDTKVLPARLSGRKRETGGRVELLLVKREAEAGTVWSALARPASRLPPGTVIDIAGGGLEAEIVSRAEADNCIRVAFRAASGAGGEDDDLDRRVEEAGEVPLPPYLGREAEPSDRIRYQTVYARQPGAVAAPTAGLHFTSSLLEQIEALGTGVVRILLHVGPGTFQPIRAEDPRAHRLTAEFYEVGAEATAELNRRRQAGGRIIAVGTTAVRTLETVAAAAGDDGFQSARGWTDLFVSPPFDFCAADALVTNFHLPRSSLLLLVAAFIGLDRLKQVYAEAMAAGYRFYSYGDAMLIV